MSEKITMFQVGLVNKLIKRGKPIEKEVFNAILGYNAINKDLTGENIRETLYDLFPTHLYNRMVQDTSLVFIKLEP